MAQALMLASLNKRDSVGITVPGAVTVPQT